MIYSGSAVTEADDRIIYNSATGALLFDAYGVSGVAAVQFATLSPGLASTAGEFTVI
jgi:serralysin